MSDLARTRRNLTREEREARQAAARRRQRLVDIRDNVIMALLFGSLVLMVLVFALALVAAAVAIALWLWQVVL